MSLLKENVEFIRVSKKSLRKIYYTILNIIQSNIRMNHILHENGRDGVDEVPGD